MKGVLRFFFWLFGSVAAAGYYGGFGSNFVWSCGLVARTFGKSMHGWALFAITQDQSMNFFFRWKRRLAEKLSVKLKLAGLIKLMPEKVVHLCSLLAVTTQSAHAWTNSWALTIRNLTWRTRLAPLSEKKGKCWLCSPQLIINISQRLWSSWSQDQPSATHTKKKENCHLHAARC